MFLPAAADGVSARPRAGSNPMQKEWTLKKFAITGAVVISSMLMSASLASAAKPADGQTGGKSAIAKACAAEKKSDKTAFNVKYGKHAMRSCIKATRSVSAEEKAIVKNAAQECKAERAADPMAFEADYGTGRNGNDAYGKCVSSKAKDATAASDDPAEVDDDYGEGTDPDDDYGEDTDPDDDDAV